MFLYFKPVDIIQSKAIPNQKWKRRHVRKLIRYYNEEFVK